MEKKITNSLTQDNPYSLRTTVKQITRWNTFVSFSSSTLLSASNMEDRELRHSTVKMFFMTGTRSATTRTHREIRSTSSSVIIWNATPKTVRIESSSDTKFLQFYLTKPYDWLGKFVLHTKPNSNCSSRSSRTSRLEFFLGSMWKFPLPWLVIATSLVLVLR